MQLLCLGLNHKTAPLAVRERVAFGPEDTGETVALIKTRLASADAGGVTEAMILSTCNRTEIYCAAVDPKRAANSVLELIEELKGVRTTDLQPRLRLRTERSSSSCFPCGLRHRLDGTR